MVYNIIMITVNVTGHGSWIINPDKLNELITWLRSNSVAVESNTTVDPGKTLLNE